MNSVEINGYQVAGDGKTVWVNGPDGCCAARFSTMGGIDIHTPAFEQMMGKTCLDCKEGPASAEDWEHFAKQVALHFKVMIPSSFKPDGLQ